MQRRLLPLALLFAGVLLCALAAPVHAQSTGPACEAPEAHQFDFWIGTWALTWGEDGQGTNEIRRTLDGCVIEETFENQASADALRGKSVSVYDPAAGLWKQTWVDNKGGYLDFTGRLENGRMILQREATKDGQPVLQRMVWYNIADDRLDWNWEQSTDAGKTWEVLWKIAYQRVR